MLHVVSQTRVSGGNRARDSLANSPTHYPLDYEYPHFMNIYLTVLLWFDLQFIATMLNIISVAIANLKITAKRNGLNNGFKKYFYFQSHLTHATNADQTCGYVKAYETIST